MAEWHTGRRGPGGAVSPARLQACAGGPCGAGRGQPFAVQRSGRRGAGGHGSLAGGPRRDRFLIGLPGLPQGGLGRIADFGPGQDALPVAGGPDGFGGYGFLGWRSPSKEILVDPALLAARSAASRITVLADDPPRQYWDACAELPRVRDPWIQVPSGTTVVADACDPATARSIEAPSTPAVEALSPPSTPSPATSELHLL